MSTYSSQLTVANARAQFAALVNPANLSDPNFLVYLNQVCERYIDSGMWKGMIVAVDFPVINTLYTGTDGYISCPENTLSVLNAQYRDIPIPTFGQAHEYFISGPGAVNDSNPPNGTLIDMGEFCTQADVPSSGTYQIQLNCGVSDPMASVRVFGINTDGFVVYDATGKLGVTLTGNDALTTDAFAKVTNVEKTATNEVVTLSARNVSGGALTALSYYYPNERVPLYRRYKVGTTNNNTSPNRIRVLCRRRFFPVAAETDLVVPGNLNAIGYGIRARKFEEMGDYNSADGLWQRGLEVLNNEARNLRGGATINPPVTYWQGENLPWTN